MPIAVIANVTASAVLVVKRRTFFEVLLIELLNKFSRIVVSPLNLAASLCCFVGLLRSHM
jgi:hypothetical protein